MCMCPAAHALAVCAVVLTNTLNYNIQSGFLLAVTPEGYQDVI